MVSFSHIEDGREIQDWVSKWYHSVSLNLEKQANLAKLEFFMLAEEYNLIHDGYPLEYE